MHLVYTLVALVGLSLSAVEVSAEEPNSRYSVHIEMERGAISGVCILGRDAGVIVNEFGVTALSFRYDVRRNRVKIVDIVPQLDRWYIRRVLRRDIQNMIPNLSGAEYEYRNEKREINYRFTPIYNI